MPGLLEELQPNPPVLVFFEGIANVLSRLPWERLVRASPEDVISLETPKPPDAPELARPPASASVEQGVSVIERPGCTTADESLLVKGHLDGLARGWGGFGVLRTSKTHLEKAIEAAKLSNAPEVAEQLTAVANRLSEIKTPEQAAELSTQLDTILPAAWNLGRKCKGLSPELLTRARELAARVHAGELTKEAAIAELTRNE